MKDSWKMVNSAVRYVAGFCVAIMVLFPFYSIAAPFVVVSIKPLHSLVSAVMDGVYVPELIVQGSGSEHGYQLRPNDAKRLASAEIVFWSGPQMETFLVKPLQNLAADATIVALSNVAGVKLLDLRASGNFEAHEHAHAHEEEDGDDKGHHAHKDLHFWLDPQNAAAATRAIADVLARKDPAHARNYHENAKAYEKRLDSLTKDINRDLVPFRNLPFIVFHDAYQYFEKRFGILAAGSITISPEQAPGVRRIAEIKNKVKNLGSVCVFSEPQFEPRVVKTVIEGTSARTGVLDPLGADIASGPDHYPTLVRNLAESLKRCFTDEEKQ